MADILTDEQIEALNFLKVHDWKALQAHGFAANAEIERLRRELAEAQRSVVYHACKWHEEGEKADAALAKLEAVRELANRDFSGEDDIAAHEMMRQNRESNADPEYVARINRSIFDASRIRAYRRRLREIRAALADDQPAPDVCVWVATDCGDWNTECGAYVDDEVVEEVCKCGRPIVIHEPPSTDGDTPRCSCCGGDPNDDDHNDPMWGCPGRCSECGAPHEHVRPGKTQPTCRCWDTQDEMCCPMCLREDCICTQDESSGEERCYACAGSGSPWGYSNDETCPVCDGTGKAKPKPALSPAVAERIADHLRKERFVYVGFPGLKDEDARLELVQAIIDAAKEPER